MFSAYGPQGSGKTSSTQDYLKGLGLDPVEVNIDDITTRYANEVLKDPEVCQKSEGYFRVRKGWPTFGRKELMERCAERRLDMLFETTGRSLSTWKYRAKPFVHGEQNYMAVVIYVLVPYVELVKRVISRYRASGQAYAGFRELLNQVKTAASNTNLWFDSPEEGGFVYFDNNRGLGKQQRINSAQELAAILDYHPFLKHMRETIQWRGISDEKVLARSHKMSISTADAKATDSQKERPHKRFPPPTQYDATYM